MTVEMDEPIDMGPEEELKPKRRRGRPPKEKVPTAIETETHPGPIEEPPLATEEELVTIEAALDIFSEDMSPAERSRLTQAISEMKQPRGRVTTEKSLVEKLVEVMAAVDAVEKKGRNDAQKYNYQRATDVFNAVRPEFIKRGILMTMSIINQRATVIPRDKGISILSEIEVEFTVQDGTQTITFGGVGNGIDTGDKGVFKAITGAMKYGVRQLLMLPDENDPEVARHDEKPESNTGGTVTITGASVTGVQQGGRQTKATTAQISALKKTAGELGMTPEALEAHIISTLGRGPELDPELSPTKQATAIVEWCEALSFDECGQLVKGLVEALDRVGITS